jgi:Transposase DDE domain
MASLNSVALDGTVKRSSNARSAVGRRHSLEQKLAALDQQVEALMQEAGQVDEQEEKLFGESSPSKLPRQLKDLKARQERLAAALKKVQETDARQKARGRGKKDGPAVPLTDPDSSLMKNKTGGFAPNHLIMVATESRNGFIVDCDVATDSDEPSSVMPVMDRLQQNFGEPAAKDATAENATEQDAVKTDAVDAEAATVDANKEDAVKEDAARHDAATPAAGPGVHVVRQLLADTNFNTGSNLRQLTDAGIEPFMPVRQSAETSQGESSQSPPSDASPPDVPATHALSPNGPSQPKTLDKSLFVFNAQRDEYQCPVGRTLPFFKSGTDQRKEGPLRFRTYQSTDCGNCARSTQCLSGKARTRSIRRDEHEQLREQLAARMSTQTGKTICRRRSHIAETPFAVMNTTMNFHQHLLRGLAKARIELNWFATAYNLKKLATLLSGKTAAVPAI